jgi:hypothetical protein
MANLCKNQALDMRHPAPFIVLQHIFLDIARDWEDRPLPVDEAKRIESKLLQPLHELVTAIESGTKEEIFDLLNNVVSAYLLAFG